MTSGFGLAYLRKSGCAMHPDDHGLCDESTDEEYTIQALKYMKDTGDVQACFVRDELITTEMRGAAA